MNSYNNRHGKASANWTETHWRPNSCLVAWNARQGAEQFSASSAKRYMNTDAVTVDRNNVIFQRQ